MATLQDYRDERLRKLNELRQLGINPYPSESSRTHVTADITGKFDEMAGQIVTVAGRIVGIRKLAN
jgi:lysyl-tRNA synthetase class 2